LCNGTATVVAWSQSHHFDEMSSNRLIIKESIALHSFGTAYASNARCGRKTKGGAPYASGIRRTSEQSHCTDASRESAVGLAPWAKIPAFAGMTMQSLIRLSS
jgi:hypothetical protein